MNHPPTKRVINPQNQLIYAKNAFYVQLSLVLREHVNQNCTARLKKIGTDSSLCITSSEAKRSGYRRENIFIFCFKVMMIKCQHVFMLTDSRCCWQYRALSISRSYNSGKDFLKHGFGACITNFFARIFAYPTAPRRAKNMPVIKEKEAFKIWSFSYYTPLRQSAVTFTKRLTYKPTFKRYSVVITPKEANTWSIYLFKLATMLLNVWKKKYFLVLSSMSICYGGLTFYAFQEKIIKINRSSFCLPKTSLHALLVVLSSLPLLNIVCFSVGIDISV